MQLRRRSSLSSLPQAPRQRKGDPGLRTIYTPLLQRAVLASLDQHAITSQSARNHIAITSQSARNYISIKSQSNRNQVVRRVGTGFHLLETRFEKRSTCSFRKISGPPSPGLGPFINYFGRVSPLTKYLSILSNLQLLIRPKPPNYINVAESNRKVELEDDTTNLPNLRRASPRPRPKDP